MSRFIWWSVFVAALASLMITVNYEWERIHSAHRLDFLSRFWRQCIDNTTDVPIPQQCVTTGKDHEIGIGSCKLTGNIKDCGCDYHTVNRVNQDCLFPLISKLARTPFFKYFKVNLWCDCPLWPEDGMCVLQACSVCECKDGEVPQPWIDEEKKLHTPCNTTAIVREFTVDRTMDADVKQQLIGVPGWRGFNNPWMPEDDSEVEYSYINLEVNPERFTGYKGENPRRVWSAIYSQSCFADTATPNYHSCTEKRVFYKLISGLHSSITAHVVQETLLDEEKNIWGPNVEMFKWTLGNPGVKDRVDNLYFTFLFVLRAVTKAGDFLKGVHYNTGDKTTDTETFELVKQLVDVPQLKAACPVPFDEGRLWKGDEGPLLKAQLRDSFHNITKIMDCVGCEKCKLWGKLQMLGLATALKVLFHDVDCMIENVSDPSTPQPFILERNEVIALINTLDRLSEGIETYRLMSLMLDEHDHQQ